MTDRMTYFITGNEMPRSVSLFLENLLYYQKHRQENPLYIETEKSVFFSSKRRERSKEKSPLHLDYYPDLDLTCFSIERLKKDAGSLRKDAILRAERGFSRFYLYADMNETAPALLSTADYVMFVMKNDSYAAGYLYTAMKLIKEKSLRLQTGCVITGVRYLEDAVLYFLKLKNETENLLGESVDCDFLGYYFLDIPRISHAQKAFQPLLKMFPGCGFHGMIKFIDARLA
ncbi:MAG TPA: hypothetical protein ENN69_08765, partial [Spirochaetia bacterium]|nr:hypothetical protein [Spirochaetia bacterium]